jgi:hypothetical protein
MTRECKECGCLLNEHLKSSIPEICNVCITGDLKVNVDYWVPHTPNDTARYWDERGGYENYDHRPSDSITMDEILEAQMMCDGMDGHLE